jgi:hypothetical protein
LTTVALQEDSFRRFGYCPPGINEVSAMSKILRGCLLLIPVFLLSGCGQGDISFADDVQPIFAKSCISCHSGSGEGATASAYVMLDYDSVMKGTEFGAVVVPGSRMSSCSRDQDATP